MAAAGNITLAANVVGGLDGSRSFGPVTITTAAAVTQTVSVALIVGATTLTVPAGSTAVVLFPPNSANPIPNPVFGGTVTVKGISGDTGVTVSNKWPTLLGFDTATAPANFVIASTVVGTMTAWFM